MADYKKMYSKLFIEMNDTIDHFKKTLLDVEEIYVETEDENDREHEVTVVNFEKE